MNNSTPTSIAQAMIAAEIRRARDGYDRACKRLLSEKEVLGWILHECLDEFKDVSPSEIASTYIEGNPEVGTLPLHADDAASLVVGMNSEDTSLDEGTVWYDIRFHALVPGTDQRMGMIVNVEAQGDFTPGYPLLKRAMYYCGRMLSSQYGRVFAKSQYEKLQKVCSIWICPNPSPAFRNTVTSYAMAEQNLFGSAYSERSEYDLVEIVLVCPDGDRQQKGDGILRLLGTLIASERDVDERKAIINGEFGIPMTQQLSQEVSEMGSWLSKGLEERATERGIELGIEQGLEQGITRGIEQGIAQGIEQGLEQGIAQGIEQGIEQGLEQGRKQGIAQGEMRARQRIARLGALLAEQDRVDEFMQALSDDDKLSALFKEAEL